jgi:hypothetical protein
MKKIEATIDPAALNAICDRQSSQAGEAPVGILIFSLWMPPWKLAPKSFINLPRSAGWVMLPAGRLQIVEKFSLSATRVRSPASKRGTRVRTPFKHFSKPVAGDQNVHEPPART